MGVRDPHRKLLLFILRNFCGVIVGTATSNHKQPAPNFVSTVERKHEDDRGLSTAYSWTLGCYI